MDIKNLRLVMLAMPTLKDMRQTVKLLGLVGYPGLIAAVTRYEDDRVALEKTVWMQCSISMKKQVRVLRNTCVSNCPPVAAAWWMRNSR